MLWKLHNETMCHCDLLHFCHGLELEIFVGQNNKTANRLNLLWCGHRGITGAEVTHSTDCLTSV